MHCPSTSIARSVATVLAIFLGAAGPATADESAPAKQAFTLPAVSYKLTNSCSINPASGEIHGWQVMAAVHTYIAIHREDNGALALKDDQTGETRSLEFIEVRPIVRHLKSNSQYVVCTDFRQRGSKDIYYDIDFWLAQETANLEVKDIKMHKVPVQENGRWTQVSRYTFERTAFDVTN